MENNNKSQAELYREERKERLAKAAAKKAKKNPSLSRAKKILGKVIAVVLVVAICFAVCLFLSPVASLVPTCATAPALIYVGVLMMKGFAKVDMSDLRSAVPAFLALIMMPLTYSISNGIGIGAIAYVLITLFTGKYKKNDIGITVIAALFVIKFVFVTM